MKYLSGKNVLTEKGWERDLIIGINEEGRIASIEKSAERTDMKADHQLDLVLPAMVNLHSHTFQRAMAGLTEARGPDPRDSFWTWRTLMYKFLDRLSPDQVEKIASLVFMEMLEAGYSSVVEFHYVHHGVGGAHYDRRSELSDRIINAAEATGIGLTLLPVYYQHGGCDERDLQGGQLRFKNEPEDFAKLFEEASARIKTSHTDYNIGVAPHSIRAINRTHLPDMIALAGDGPVHMHLAEQVAEVEEVEAHLGSRPTDWLLDNYPVNERWCLIHCTQMTASETKRLAETGAVAGLCPITESSLGDGIFNGVEFLGHNGNIGVGSDSNIHISMFDELKTLDYSQRLRDKSRAALATREKSTGRNLFDLSLKGGTQAAQRESGAIKEGMLADLIGLETDNHWIGNRSGDIALDCLIFGGHGQRCITDVWSAGRHVIKNGMHAKRETITRGFIQTLEELGQDI